MTTVGNVISATARDVVDDLARVGIQLDGSEASLSVLDDAIEILWGEARPSDEYFDGIVWGYGCYVADVIQRHHAGAWMPADDTGYNFVLADGVAGINPWYWVERRLQLGDLLERAYRSFTDIARRADMQSTKANATSKTNISIQGTGVSLAFLEIDQESFMLLTQAGVTEADYQQLIDDVEDEGRREEGLRVDDLAVTVDGEVFTCSWDKLRPQLENQCLMPQKPYARLKAGTYLLVYEKTFESRWEGIDVEGYSHSKLRFNVESVEPSRGTHYLLLDFTFDSDAPGYVATYSEDGMAYVVDRQGKRHTIKVAYEW